MRPYWKAFWISGKKYFLATILFCCVVFCCLAQFTPKSVLETLHLEKSRISECYVSAMKPGGAGTDLNAKQVEKITEFLETVNIRFVKLEFNITVPVDTEKYMLFLQTDERNTAEIVITSNGYMFIEEKKYEIIRDGGPDIVEHLRHILA